jgi:thiamine biosynthesis lipoprotein
MTPAMEYSFSAMACDCTLHLHAAGSLADRVAEAVIDEVLRIEAAYSRYRDDSVLSRINRVAESGGTIDVDEETATLLDYAFACYDKSAGLFDISSGVLREAWRFDSQRLPAQATLDALLTRVGLHQVQWQAPRLRFGVPHMQLDLGGIGKEYAADRAAEVCEALGVSSGLVDLGGDLRVLGPHPDGTPWTVHIRHPRQLDTALASIGVGRGAIASSGDYERYMEVDGRRYCHILDPRSGWPVQELAAVSVVADRCLVAGSLSTIAMLKGAGGAAWLATLGVPYLWMDTHGRRGGTF